MTDRHAVIWTLTDATPIKMANLVMTPKECRITYTKAFIEAGSPGFSLMADPAVIKEKTLVWPSTELRPLHPRLMAMIPPNHAGNLQRRIYAEILDRLPNPPVRGMETEWEILMLAGRGGIGHLDVFRDDREALDWYSHKKTTPLVIGQNARSELWQILKNEVRQLHNNRDGISDLANIMGATPTAGGMIDKVLISIPDPDKEPWDGTSLPSGSITTSTGNIPFVDVVIKIEAPQYEGLLDLESLCLDVHRESGFEVPRYWRLNKDGLKLLAIERFDRTLKGHTIPLESMMTIISSGSRNVQSSQDVLWPELGKMISKIARVCNLEVNKTQGTLFRRLAYALMTGNGDMHLDNIGLLGGKQAARLAPVYDPAPMRAWPRHNMRMAIPIDFESGSPIYTQIAETAPSFGLTIKQGKDMLREAFDATTDFRDRVMHLENVPIERRQALIAVVEHERQHLQSACETPEKTPINKPKNQPIGI